MVPALGLRRRTPGILRARLQGRLASVDGRRCRMRRDVARFGALAFARVAKRVAPERIEPAYPQQRGALTIAERQALRNGR